MTRIAPLPDLERAGVITRRELEALHLHYHSGLTVPQIMLALDLSRSAVRSRLSNGLRKIELHQRKAAA